MNYLYIVVGLLVIVYIAAVYGKDTFDVSNRWFGSADNTVKPTIELIYADWCSACRAFWPTWESAKANLGHLANFVEINDDKTDTPVKAFPTLRMRIGKSMTEHIGSMRYEDLRFWILNRYKK